MKYYEILQVKETDTIEVIKKNINHSLKMASDRHPPETKLEAEQKFKDISKAYKEIEKNHGKTSFYDKTSFYGNIHTDADFKNFTEKLINKGTILKNIIDKAKNIDLKNFLVYFLNI